MPEVAGPTEYIVRRSQASDIEAGSRIVYEAFKSIADLRGFEPDFPSVDIAQSMTTIFINHPKFFGVAAEIGGELAGLNFLSERNAIRGVGPMVVDPKLHGRGIGRVLMNAVIARGKDAPGIRLVQDAANTVSLALYSSLGFEIREPLFLMFGKPRSEPPSGYQIRPMQADDLTECNELCYRAHGFDRSGELVDAMTHFGSLVLLRRGRIVAYATAPTLWVMNHGVAESDKDLKALLAHAAFTRGTPLSLLVPGRNASLLQWCLAEGLRVAKPMTLMTLGTYQDPKTPWYPSVEY
jgi:GNAT superfamily N-acetyltransferase